MGAQQGKSHAVILKKIGETPLQALEAFRVSASLPESTPLTYAGRLDPMAEGKLIILIGEECKRRGAYDGLDKEYEFEVLLGFSSDTGDVLGIPDIETPEGGLKEYSEKELQSLAHSLVGTHELPYPAFSSKTVNGKPLFQHALAGTLEDIEVPIASRHIYRATYIGQRGLRGEDLIRQVIEKIERLKAPAGSGLPGADFRKEEIIERWKSLSSAAETDYTILKFRAIVSSGTYIRALAPVIAGKLGRKGLAYSIRRTKIGRFQPLILSLGFWRKVFKQV